MALFRSVCCLLWSMVMGSGSKDVKGSSSSATAQNTGMSQQLSKDSGSSSGGGVVQNKRALQDVSVFTSPKKNKPAM